MSLKFPVFMREKLGLATGSKVFFSGSGSFKLDPKSKSLAGPKIWARSTSTPSRFPAQISFIRLTTGVCPTRKDPLDVGGSSSENKKSDESEKLTFF